MLQKLSKTDDSVSAWSGGTTTQLAIWPPEAKYADRDFLWRISSATVDLAESDFTPLPDYDRLIATLEGEIELIHNGGAPLTLRPLEVHAFSGADATHCRGRCRDFNLMLRRGKVTGTMEALRLAETPAHPPIVCSAGNLPAKPTCCLLYCVEGEATAFPNGHFERGEAESKNPFPLLPGEVLLLTEPASLTLTGPAVLMLCRMRAW